MSDLTTTVENLHLVPPKMLTRAIDQRWDKMYLWALKASTTLRLLVETGALTPGMRLTVEKMLEDDPTA